MYRVYVADNWYTSKKRTREEEENQNQNFNTLFHLSCTCTRDIIIFILEISPLTLSPPPPALNFQTSSDRILQNHPCPWHFLHKLDLSRHRPPK